MSEYETTTSGAWRWNREKLTLTVKVSSIEEFRGVIPHNFALKSHLTGRTLNFILIRRIRNRDGNIDMWVFRSAEMPEINIHIMKD